MPTVSGNPIIPSFVDNVPGGVQIQRGGSLPNPTVSSILGNTQSGPGGRASSLSSSEASRSPTAVVSHTTTSSAYKALIWKMNERGPTGMHTPAALASLAELLANPAAVPGSQQTNLDSCLGTVAITENVPQDKDDRTELRPVDQKSEARQVEAEKAKVKLSIWFES